MWAVWQSTPGGVVKGNTIDKSLPSRTFHTPLHFLLKDLKIFILFLYHMQRMSSKLSAKITYINR